MLISKTIKQIIKENVERLKIKKADLQTAKLTPEVVHDMRVATRRLRAAIKVFKKMLPEKAENIRAELKGLGRILGKKRDLDVFSEFIWHSDQLKHTGFQTLTRQNERAQKKILQMLKSKEYADLFKLLERMKVVRKKVSLKEFEKQIKKAFSKTLEIAPSIRLEVDDQTLHKFRICIKKLRYICEFFEPIFCRYSFFIEKTKEIQDILGDYHDAITGISMLTQRKNKFSLEEFLHIKKRYEQKKARTRNAFLKIWKAYRRLL